MTGEGTGGMVHQVKVFIAFAVVWSLIPSTHIRQLTVPGVVN